MSKVLEDLLGHLALEKIGGKVLYATDEFFAGKENLIKESEPVFHKGKFVDTGQWMDGWESWSYSCLLNLI